MFHKINSLFLPVERPKPMSTEERRAHYDAISEAYHALHARCPKCGGLGVEQTTAPWTNFHSVKVVEDAINRNKAHHPACGWSGVVDDLLPMDLTLQPAERVDE